MAIKLTGTGNINQLGLVKLLEQKKGKYWIRHVFVPQFSDVKDEYMINLGRMIANLKYMGKFELLPYHNMAIVKYDNLDWDYPLRDLEPPSKEMIAKGMKLLNQGIEIARKDPSKSLL